MSALPPDPRRGPSRAEGGAPQLGEDFQCLLDCLPDPAWIYIKEDRAILAANAAATRRYGWSREEFLRMTMLDIRPPSERDRFLALTERTPPYRELRGESRHWTKDGAEFLVDVDARDIPFQGKACRFVVARDAFERKMAWTALQEAQETYSGLVETLEEGVAILDEEGRFIYVNSACGRIFGVAADSLLGSSTKDLIAPEARARHAQELAARAKGASGAYEIEVVRAGGERRWIAVRAAPRKDSSGRFAGTVASFFDITEHRMALEAQRQSEARFRRLVEMLPQGLVTYQDGRITYANPAATAITRTDPATVLGRPIADFIHPDDRAMLAERYGRIARGEDVPPQDYTFLRGDGTSVRTETSGKILEPGPKPVLVSVFSDLTRRLEVEQALRESEERYRSVIEQAQDMIFLVDLDSKAITEANRAFHDTLGYAPGDLSRLTLYGLVDADRESVDRNIASVRRQGSHAIGRRRYLHADGSAKDVEVSGSICRAGGQEFMVVLARDITARLATEQAMQQSQKLESLGVLAGGIAHDFNNLLTAMMGNLSLAQLRSHPSSPSWPYLDALEKSLQRASELTRQMLAYSGKGRFLTKVLDLNQVVEEMTHLLAVSISKRVALRFDLEKGLPPVDADPAQLQQVVMNLVTNASDAIGDREGAIRIATGLVELDAEEIARDFPAQAVDPGRHLLLEVADTGCGMAAETLARIFEPFFTTKAAGRGLGLSAMLGILKGHRAGLRIQTALGQGTTFRIYLPVRAGARIEEPREAPAQVVKPAGAVLVADDEAGIRSGAVEIFKLIGFPAVLEAADGLEALEVFKARRGEIALVFMDLTMPRMSGRDAFRAMRELDPAIPVILTSGYNEDSLPDGEARPSAFLQKPYRMRQLQETVTAVLKERGTPLH